MKNNNYYGWGVDQHPQSLLQQMEKQIKSGEFFISIFRYYKKFKQYLSVRVDVVQDFNNYNFSLFSEKEKNKILEYKNCWILISSSGKKRIIPMWDGEKISNPFIKKVSKKGYLKKLLILRDAYSGTEKQKEILEEIEKIEKELEMTIEEYINF